MKLVLFGLLMPFFFAKGVLAAPAAKPNIIVIMTDDMGYSDIGCYGSEINTPNLDALASSGIRFSQFYNAARCCPTRASLLTGVYPHQAAVGHMTDRDLRLEGYRGDLSHECVTLAEVMRGSGYGTYMVGKWHVTRNDKPGSPTDNWPLQRGFDRFYGTIRGGGNYFDPPTLARDNTMISPFADPEYKPGTYYYTDAITEHAVRFIKDHRQKRPDKPFFMYVAYTAAHWPMQALPEDIARYKGKYDGGYEPIRQARLGRLRKLGLISPEWALSPPDGDWAKVENKEWEARCMEVYAAMVDRMDQGVGRIVGALKQQQQLDNTLILYLQDNGACREVPGRRDKGKGSSDGKKLPVISPDAVRTDIIPRQTRDGKPVRMGVVVMPGPEDTFIAYGEGWANVGNTPFRYYKHFAHEGGISTPLIAHWPDGIKRRGEIEAQPGHLVDIMATCVEVAGANYPTEYQGHPIKPMEGRSLVPAFNGKLIQREALFWEHEENRAIRVGDWKLVALWHDHPWELYDMAKDRTEMHDLARAEPQRVREMSALWENWARRTQALPWPWGKPYGVKEKESSKQ